MKFYVIGKDDDKNPCVNCGMGSGSCSSGEDANGKYYESTSCKDTCSKYKQCINSKAL